MIETIMSVIEGFVTVCAAVTFLVSGYTAFEILLDRRKANKLELKNRKTLQDNLRNTALGHYFKL